MAQIFIVGTCDTKYAEIMYVANIIRAQGGETCIVDVGVFDKDFPPFEGRMVRLREKRPDFFNNINDRG
ncbi:Tm-1-like ATP-binding domain-containing protein, partial [Mailhella massiliensis]